MHFLAFKDVIILPNRQRKTFDETRLQELAESIRDKGLMHAPVVRDDGRTLVVGERRTKAMAYLAHMNIPFSYNGQPVERGFMPVSFASELGEFKLREAELEENLCRVDLTWQEEAMAIAELTALRREQDPNWTPKDTAREIDREEDVDNSPTYTKARDAEILKNYLDDPDVLKAKSAREAASIIKKKVQRKTNEMLATVHNAADTQHTILNGSMLDILPTLQDETYSVILTDPPYGVNADKFGAQASAEHEYEDDIHHALRLVEVLAKEGFRICRKEAHAYVFCDIRVWPMFSVLFAEAGWDVWPTPLIWVKGNGMLPRPEHGPRRCYETILYANKGDKKINSVQPDVVVCAGVARPTFGAEKPAEVYANLLRRSTVPGDKVLDCFAGAGPIIPASNECCVTATAIELNKDKYNHILLRVDEGSTVEKGAAA
jgi:DNA modification methylase